MPSKRAVAMVLSLIVATPAFAGSTKNMTVADLITMLTTDTNVGHQEDAANELGARRALEATEALGQGCGPTQDIRRCWASTQALASFRTPAAYHQLDAMILSTVNPKAYRMSAARQLGKADQVELAKVAPLALARYRSLETDFVKLLVSSLPAGGNKAAEDYTILIATDTSVEKPARLAALDAAERFNHPRLFDAYLALVKDPEKSVRVRCAEALGRSGAPASVVVPVLMDVGQNDDNGDVRAAVLKALRNYASPQILPLLNWSLINERNVFAIVQAAAMMPSLADASSIPALSNVYTAYDFADATMTQLIQASIRIGDPALIPALTTLAGRTTSEPVRAEANRAIAALQGPPAGLVTYLTTVPMIELRVSDVSAGWVAPPPLAMTVDVNGAVMMPASVQASLVAPGLGVSWGVDASGSLTVQVDGGSATVGP